MTEPQTPDAPYSPADAVITDPLARLRAAFPDKAVGKLPRITCKACSKAEWRVCSDHRKEFCNGCKQKMTTEHIHLDYVGHAEVTDRLLSVDPLWTWEPMSYTDDGFPLVKRGTSGEWTMWIKLTVCGTTRLGVGSVDNGHDAEKQLIGDALRNAAMRFGVALDLWSKSELESSLDDTPITGPPAEPVRTPNTPPDPNARDAVKEGWESEAIAVAMSAELAASISGSAADVVVKIREYRTEIGSLWPPTKNHYLQIKAKLRELNPDAPIFTGSGPVPAAADRNQEERPDVAPDDAEAPGGSQAEVADAPGESDPEPTPVEAEQPAAEAVDPPVEAVDTCTPEQVKAEAAVAFVAGLDDAAVLAHLTARAMTPERLKTDRRSQLSDVLYDDEAWEPHQEALDV